jgi:hypothetical protein
VARRGRDRRSSEAFGTSLADILTTALGCVVLLFLVAVTRMKGTLGDEVAAHTRTQAALVATADQRAQAEAARAEEHAERTAAERAQLANSAALAAAENAKLSLADRLLNAEAERERLAAELGRARARTGALEAAARSALSELDPRTAKPVDIMLVIDGTKSMGDSLDATRRNLRSVVGALKVVSPTARVGVVVFRDKRESKALRLQSQPLTDDVDALLSFLDGVKATSTKVDKDRPEWLCGGIRAGAAAQWREDAIRLLVVVSDAAAQERRAKSCLRVAKAFAESGGRVSIMSTRPTGYGRNRKVTRDYRKVVLPQHGEIARVGGGTHVQAAEPDALLTEVLQSAFTSRTAAPLDGLRDALRELPPEAPATP